MSILIDRSARILIQGMTGRLGSGYTQMMAEYGRNVVGGVTPGKGGEWFEGLPVFDTVVKAVEATEATVSVVMVPASAAPDAILEAADAGMAGTRRLRLPRRHLRAGRDPVRHREDLRRARLA